MAHRISKWKLLDSEMVLDEKWYRVRKDTVEVRPGKVVDDYYVGLFNNIVLIAAVTDDGQLPMVRQYKHGAGEVLLEVPAGYMDDGESPLAAAKRELQEETGFTAKKWQKLGCFYTNSAKSRGNMVNLFLATDAVKTHEQRLDENEDIEIVMKPFEEAVRMARRGDLKGSDTVLTLLLAEGELS